MNEHHKRRIIMEVDLIRHHFEVSFGCIFHSHPQSQQGHKNTKYLTRIVHKGEKISDQKVIFDV